MSRRLKSRKVELSKVASANPDESKVILLAKGWRRSGDGTAFGLHGSRLPPAPSAAWRLQAGDGGVYGLQ